MPVEASPMITWGKIEDTMFLGMSKSYKVPETPMRDELGFKMATKNQSKKRDLKEQEK